MADGSRRQQEKKKSTTEKTVSLSVLQQYFSGSLKDAATNIGGKYPYELTIFSLVQLCMFSFSIIDRSVMEPS